MYRDNFRQYLFKASYKYDKCTKLGRMNASKILNGKIDSNKDALHKNEVSYCT